MRGLQCCPKHAIFEAARRAHPQLPSRPLCLQGGQQGIASVDVALAGPAAASTFGTFTGGDGASAASVTSGRGVGFAPAIGPKVAPQAVLLPILAACPPLERAYRRHRAAKARGYRGTIHDQASRTTTSSHRRR